MFLILYDLKYEKLCNFMSDNNFFFFYGGLLKPL